MPGDAGEGVLCLQDQRDVFHLERESGVIPAATAGGQPGQTTVRVRFQEHSDVRYECAYCVYVNGDPTEEVIVLRGDSREVEA
ncbi:hypothetical protein AGDE_15246 [Angomonas deanei]|uniref:Uncharacterized protein n=1 Tax=Angomonas deanei TaxID=59799 RepID=A0A7G2CCY9_9TRYP|nr:hypothetical protein AGDE_15246 [Angomonas deanei]CAD2217305.1 hypothetical protein, conserved [Angomonas deanei]|eukprot:EPY19425.1 hypothetical protein AGDE_15246 [Angomonas deanei]